MTRFEDPAVDGDLARFLPFASRFDDEAAVGADSFLAGALGAAEERVVPEVKEELIKAKKNRKDTYEHEVVVSTQAEGTAQRPK